MASRRTPPLAFSEYVSPNTEDSIQTWRARMEMIEAVGRVHPAFLEGLASEVFPIYCRYAKTRLGLDEALSSSDRPIRDLEQRSRLRLALSNWANQFNVNSDWLVNDALRTVVGWHRVPAWLKTRTWSQMHARSDRAAIGEAVEFHCDGWEVQLVTWSDYRTLVRKRFEDYLSEYERRTREFAESLGLTRAQRKYSSENFGWFVLYQFAGKSYTEILDLFGPEYGEESTVRKGIAAAAKLIGWDSLRTPGQQPKPEN